MKNSTKNLPSAAIHVKFRSGYKGEEAPRSIQIGNEEKIIDRILSRKRIRDRDSGIESEIFEVEVKEEKYRITVRRDESPEIVLLPENQ